MAWKMKAVTSAGQASRSSSAPRPWPKEPLKTKIEAECGGLDAIERTPACRVNLRFTPAAVTKEQGEIVLDGKLTPGDITVITADTVTPVAAQ